jgi:hypothetical protein
MSSASGSDRGQGALLDGVIDAGVDQLDRRRSFQPCVTVTHAADVDESGLMSDDLE